VSHVFHQCYAALSRAAGNPVVAGDAGDPAKTRYRGGVAEQRRAGDWLTGVLTAKSDSRYPGERLGLPQEGPRSVARMGRRVAALFADWLLCTRRSGPS
jgi:hypothetical protein